MKEKEKTARGSARPIGGLEKAITKKKKKKNDPLQMQHQSTSMPETVPLVSHRKFNFTHIYLSLIIGSFGASDKSNGCTTITVQPITKCFNAAIAW